MATYGINSTHWRGSMDSSSAVIDNNRARDPQPDLATILPQLEESLRISQQALLGRNLASFEEQTTVQTALFRKLEACLPHQLNEKWDARAVSFRVSHLAQVQLGLLRRAQRSARMLCHLMATSEPGYGDLAAVQGFAG